MPKFNPYADVSIKQDHTDAALLNREQVSDLMGWCDFQDESLWDGMTMQEILNIWHVSIEYDSFEGWAQERGDEARKQWNRVTYPNNHLMLKEGA